ncbi:MAG TPA: hypothetical protein VLV15_06435 [Dongiaceae bacterium]|nr:hypothetical protein [Dongiaceae bacterium]
MLIFENLETTPRYRLFAWLGVEWQATPWAWLSVPCFLLLGLAVAWAADRGSPIDTRVGDGLAYGVLLMGMIVLHSVGHVAGARLVGSPAGVVLITATFHVNTHRCTRGVCSPRLHIGRSLGGPVMNLLTGGLALAARGAAGSRWLDFFGKASLIVGAWTLLPIPTLDGWVIWGELIGFRRRTA